MIESIEAMYKWLDSQIGKDLIRVAAGFREKFELTLEEASKIMLNWSES
jgi:hypothetical protein